VAAHRPVTFAVTFVMVRFIASIIRPTVRDQRELIVYVASATALAVMIALAIDVANQLVFFVDWATCFRSWAVTIFAAIVIAVPILYGIGRTHLALHQAKVTVERLSLMDPLTGLANRRAILDHAEAAAGTTLVLIIIDLDRFKSVNDTHGHRVGDLVLKSVGQQMAAELGSVGIVGRLGGEEFAVLSSDTPPDIVLRKVEGFCTHIAAMPIVAHGVAVKVTVSAGAAVGSGQSFDALYADADRALYAAKAAGRNRICLSAALQKAAVA
jgi:diguanylate cyclase (GGDEF)-like protein